MFAQCRYRTQPSGYFTVDGFSRRTLALSCLLLSCLVLAGAMSLWATPAAAQVPGGGFGLPEPGGQYPAQTYYDALRVYRDGDLENAIRGFEMALRSTRTDINGKWIDSIPARVMLAECYWHLGHLPVCRSHLDEAARIAVRNQGWLGQLDFNSLAQGGVVAASPTNLWPEVAAVRRLPLPRKMPFQSGRQLTEQGLAAGGVIETPTIKNIDAIEVMRTLAVMSHRRRVLMGPLSVDDTLSREVAESTKLPTGLSMDSAKSLIYAMRGCQYYAIGEDKTVIDRAGKYAVVGGAVHPMTPMLLLCGLKAGAGGDEQGKLTQDNRQTLVSTAQQITNAAAALDQYEFIGEALQVAAGVAQGDQLSRVEQTALLAARTLVRQSRLASLHCYLVAADAAVSAGRVDAANEHLQAAITIASRRDVQFARLQAYGAYVAARIAAKSGQPIGIGGTGTMADALRSMSDFILNQRDRNRPVSSMPFFYQVDIVMGSLGGNVGNQSVKRLLEGYSGDVAISLWRQDPLNAMAAVYFDDSAMHSALLNIAAMENNGTEVLQQTDRLLAKRFTRQLPLQGRLLQYRTLVSSPVDALWSDARAMLAEPPEVLKRLRDETQQSLVAAAAPVAVPVDKADGKFSVRSESQAIVMEAAVSDLALSRSVVPEINPPPVATTDVALVPDGVALVTFVVDNGKLHATATRDGATRTWVVPGISRLPAMINRVLQDIGANKGRGKRVPDSDEAWRADMESIRSFLFPESSGWTEDNLTSIIVVPDGPLWYLPFELLPAVGTKTVKPIAADAEPARLWADAVELTYAPTPGMALRNVAAATTANRIAMVAGNFFAIRDQTLNESMINEVMLPAQDAVRLSTTDSPPTSLMGLEIGHLIVAAAVTPNVAEPLSTQIVPIESGTGNPTGTSSANRLRDWIRFPAGGPQSVVLAGFRSTAASNKLGDGSELFFPLVSLRASGVREVMLSRWATGGQSAATALAEVVNEVPHTRLVEALRRGTMMLRSSDLAVSREPLLGKPDEEVADLTGEQPLFWANYFASGSLNLPVPQPKK
ncbi:CHAT domain-containing protein [Neorhodopirellula pilleata]|nr:CHAT domain-containing protein [Neorhodopirellula pilleata]